MIFLPKQHLRFQQALRIQAQTLFELRIDICEELGPFIILPDPETLDPSATQLIDQLLMVIQK